MSDRLYSHFTIQESLTEALTSASLMDILPDIFKTILEITGSQKGRLLLIDRESNQTVIISANESRLDVDVVNPIPKVLIDEVENFRAQNSLEIFAAHSQGELGRVNLAHLETTTTRWSEILLPLQIEDKSIGIISASKPENGQFAWEDILQFSLFTGQLSGALVARKFKTDWQSAEERVQEILVDNQNIAAILVHDLQGPLANVLASLELLQTEVASEDKSSPALMIDIATRSSKVLESLINSLLDISRLEAGQEITELELVAISEIIDFVADVEGPVLEQRQVTLVRELEPNLPLINANVNILQRILLNLFDNAMKVSKQNQKITVSAYLDDNEDFVSVCVLDQGPGIPEAYHERIFEKYERLESASTSKGLGLGLAFCKLATEAHGGRIWVENTQDQGACFCMILPVENQAQINN
jgi:signal transduction histidine kinase